MLKELIKLANELDEKGLTKEADSLDQIIKEAQHPGYSGSPSVGQRLFQEAMNAYYDVIVGNRNRNYYRGDDAQVAQAVINAATKHFNKAEYHPDLPDQIIAAGMFVEANRAPFGDAWIGARSLFKRALEGGPMRDGGIFTTDGAETSSRIWRMFKEENLRRYREGLEEKGQPVPSSALREDILDLSE